MTTLLLLALLAPQTPTFSARVEYVFVDAFVTEDGVLVTGLTASDFEVRDNGVRQRVELASVDALPLSTILLFDTSGSMAGERLAALQAAGRAFLGGLREGDEAALITFSHAIERRVASTRELARVRRGLDETTATGSTALMDALYTTAWRCACASARGTSTPGAPTTSPPCADVLGFPAP